MNREAFFDAARKSPFGGHITEAQRSGSEAILDEWERRGLTDLRWLAYMLATAYHETAHTMQPIEEYGHGRGRAYGRPDRKTGKAYYGRGLVQLTWLRNYTLMGRLLHVDLVAHPEKALEPEIAVEIMFEGMLRAESSVGDFTGRSLEQYFTATKTDWVGARRIINGTDKASLIAGYGRAFHAALQAAKDEDQPPAEEPAKSADLEEPKPLLQSKIAKAGAGAGALTLAEIGTQANDTAEQVKAIKKSAEDIGVFDLLGHALTSPRMLIMLAIAALVGLMCWWRWRDHGWGSMR